MLNSSIRASKSRIFAIGIANSATHATSIDLLLEAVNTFNSVEESSTASDVLDDIIEANVFRAIAASALDHTSTEIAPYFVADSVDERHGPLPVGS